MKAKNNIDKVNPDRRDFLMNLSLAAAALTLNSAFGFPVETEQGKGKLFLKISVIEGDSEVKNGIFQFSETDLEKLKHGKMESLAAKVEISFDQRRWKILETSITDRNFMKQLIEISRKA